MKKKHRPSKKPAPPPSKGTADRTASDSHRLTRSVYKDKELPESDDDTDIYFLRTLLYSATRKRRRQISLWDECEPAPDKYH